MSPNTLPMNEYYIRREGDEEASGPYDMDAIVSLFEANKLDKEAFYYDMDSETWRRIGDNQEMLAVIFPEKRKLKLRNQDAASEEADEDEESEDEEEVAAKGEEAARDQAGAEAGPESGAELAQAPEEASEEAEPIEKDPAPEEAETGKGQGRRKPRLKPRPEKKRPPKPISVETMLAQAEGRDDTRPDSKTPAERQAQAAFLGLQGATLLLFLNAAAMGLMRLDLLQSANALKMAKDPFILSGVFDFLLGFVLLMQVTHVYPLIRFRSFLGIGLVSTLLLASGDPLLAGANLLVCLALFFATSLIHTPKLVGALAMGLAGIALYASVLLAPLLQGGAAE